MDRTDVRNDWTRDEIAALFDLPFDELMWQAQTVHRAHHAAGQVQLSTAIARSRSAPTVGSRRRS